MRSVQPKHDDFMICTLCNKPLPSSEFPIRSDRPQHIRSRCKPCKRICDKKSYRKRKNEDYYKYKEQRIRSRASSLKVKCDVDAEYLESIWTGICPVFGIKIIHTTDRSDESAAELDRKNPNGGYVKGNVVFMSRKANRIKNNVSITELTKILEWMKNDNRK